MFFRSRRDSGSYLPTWAARALVALTVVAVLLGTVTEVSYPANVKGLAAWAGTIGFLIAFPLAFERPNPLSVSVSGLSAVVTAFTVSGNAPFVATIATIALAAGRLSLRPGRLISALTGAGYLYALTFTAHESVRTLFSPGAGIVFTYVVAAGLHRLREEQERTRELLREVVEGRDARIQAAALEERARLAREMHDILAHTLSALAIQLEGTRMLAEQRPNDPALVETLDRASKLAREGIKEARRAVGSLRGDELPGPNLLPGLAQDFERDTGMRVAMRVEGIPRELTPDGRLALYRVAQEALTNVRKHAEATCVGLALRYGEGGVELTIENDGPGRPSPVGGGGFGLNGMRERAELVGGKLEAGPLVNGFRVHFWIPI